MLVFTFAIQFLLLTISILRVQELKIRLLNDFWSAFLAVVTAGWITFWIYLIEFRMGWIISLAHFVWLLASLWSWRHSWKEILSKIPREWWLSLGFGLCCLGLKDLYWMDAGKYFPPDGDLRIPRNVAEALRMGRDSTFAVGGWKTSERPTLQSGLYLLFSVFADSQWFEGFAVMLQTLWIPIVWNLGRCLEISKPVRKWILTVMMLSGFVYLNTIYHWPKMLGAALFLLGLQFVIKGDWARGSLSLGLSLMAHTGIAFSFPILLPWIWKKPWKEYARAGIIGLAVILPWWVYGKWINPPDGSLLKGHLAGKGADPRPFLTLLEESYSNVSGTEWLNSRLGNLRAFFPDQWTPLEISAWRHWDYYNLSLALGALLLGFMAIHTLSKNRFKLFLGVAASLLFWVIGMWESHSTQLHQGSYATVLALQFILGVAIANAWPKFLPWLAGVSILKFVLVWGFPNETLKGISWAPACGLIFGLILLKQIFKTVSTEETAL